jgi:pimeloyl-ACP methyl ester carboxylesterase
MRCDLTEVSLHYDRFGEGIPFLGLHGMPIDRSATVYEFEPVLSRRSGWQRIYVDLPGHGESPRAPWPRSDDRVLGVLVEFIDAILGSSHLVVAGTSYGASIARGLAHRIGDRIDGLCLLVPAVKPWDRALPPRSVIADAAGIAEAAKEIESLNDMAVAWPPSARQYVKALSRGTADTYYLDDVADDDRLISALQGEPPPFPAPTLFVTGRQDNICGYRDAWELLELYPRATFAVLDRAGHLLRGEQERLFSALVDEWLDRVEEWIS